MSNCYFYDFKFYFILFFCFKERGDIWQKRGCRKEGSRRLLAKFGTTSLSKRDHSWKGSLVLSEGKTSVLPSLQGRMRKQMER